MSLCKTCTNIKRKWLAKGCQFSVESNFVDLDNIYCRMLNLCESFIIRVLRGSLESQKIMLAYENRMPDNTLKELKHCERQTYELTCSRALNILQYLKDMEERIVTSGEGNLLMVPNVGCSWRHSDMIWNKFEINCVRFAMCLVLNVWNYITANARSWGQISKCNYVNRDSVIKCCKPI